MINIENDELIKREMAGRENEGLRTSVIDTYFLWYQKERQEIIPLCHYYNRVMSKEDIRTVIKGLTNFLDNHFTEEDIKRHNEQKVKEHHEYMYGNWDDKPKTKRERMFKSKVDSGFVYFIKEHFKGTVKIGKTKRIKDRTKQFG
ncbi:hypothetical protein MHI57_25010, partial [Cytobacillus sp. FSL K6-0129]|uniref:hypothetical protein n=1 Tax=Cytobacillus sp. FSL K6-0129 TaxID=2921421 RepID=UPI0030FC5708